MTAIVPTGPSAHGVPPEIMSVCSLSEYSAQHFDTRHALARLNARGLLDRLPAYAAAARSFLAPVDRNKLTDRLTALGMMMAPNRPPAEARVWLNEMTRLLSDLPEDILADAIDELVKTSKFLPTCSEIREIADERRAERARVVSQLDAMTRYVDSGQPIPTLRQFEPPAHAHAGEPCTPAEAAAIMEEFGLRAETRTMLRQHLGPPRKPTRDDYIALGVDPATLDGVDA